MSAQATSASRLQILRRQEYDAVLVAERASAISYVRSQLEYWQGQSHTDRCRMNIMYWKRQLEILENLA